MIVRTYHLNPALNPPKEFSSNCNEMRVYINNERQNAYTIRESHSYINHINGPVSVL